jgi:hypothetical protein
MVFFKLLTYNFTVAEWFARSLMNREVSGSNPSKGNSFKKKVSQINIELTISVAISLIANLLQLKHWKALVANTQKLVWTTAHKLLVQFYPNFTGMISTKSS